MELARKAPLAAVRADGHSHRERRPVSSCGRSEQRSFEMRSGSIGTTRSGKYTRIAALQGFLVELGSRLHVIGDVGDRDGQQIAAGVGGSGSSAPAWTASS